MQDGGRFNQKKETTGYVAGQKEACSPPPVHLLSSLSSHDAGKLCCVQRGGSPAPDWSSLWPTVIVRRRLCAECQLDRHSGDSGATDLCTMHLLRFGLRAPGIAPRVRSTLPRSPAKPLACVCAKRTGPWTFLLTCRPFATHSARPRGWRCSR